MKLRDAACYSIGLNLGTKSVGWAVCDETGKLLTFKGKPTWGIRHFSEADTAKDTRTKRAQRRRLDRRKQRIQALQGLFAEPMASLDPGFFIRMRQSRLLHEDKDPSIRSDRWPLFNGGGLTEIEYYDKYPTIYHLRKHLMESNEKEDLRLVYLALHHIVKYRGNFLYEDLGSTLKAANANATEAAERLAEALSDYLYESVDTDSAINPDVDALARALDAPALRAAERAERAAQALAPSGKDIEGRCKAIAKACVGYKANFATIFDGIEDKKASFALSNEEAALEFLDDACPDDATALFEAIQKAYSAYVLSGILKGAACLSDAMVGAYDRHREDLRTLKGLFKDYLSKNDYDAFFRGKADGKGYDINCLVKGSYTSYVTGEVGANRLGTSHAELLDKIRDLCSSSTALMADERYAKIADRLNAGFESDFLSKLRTRANGAIPYQLHLEELGAILARQGKHYPFLEENRAFIESLLTSRIPYYVGPLNAGPDPHGPFASDPVDGTRKFAWSQRRPGMEAAKAHPWDYEDAIDVERTADLFIQRMTGTCSYLYGEPVLPRHSLLYEEYCVLNELNGIKWCAKGGTPHRLDHVDKQRILKDLFMNRASANVNAGHVKRWLLEEHGIVDAEISGFQGDRADFASKLGSYHDFCKLFGVRDLADAPLSVAEIEEIIHWSTVFEDRRILRRKLDETYGPNGDGRLTAGQIKKVVDRRYSGWGKLSKKLLTGVKVPASVPGGAVSIMDVLRSGDPFQRLDQKVFMEIVTDSRLGFDAAIERENDRFLAENDGYLTIANMPGSPSSRRAATQAMRIVAEVAKIAGKAPSRICITINRVGGKKGSRKSKRYDALKEALKAFKEDAALLEELEASKERLDDDRLFLYFQQQGKCAYSAEPIDLNQLSSSLYQIDYIVPRAFVVDESLDNRVLVKSALNQRKHDSLLLDDRIIDARQGWWKALRDAGLFSDRKYERLICRDISERQIANYVRRQINETDRAIAYVRRMCEQAYPSAEVALMRSATVAGVRSNLGVAKLPLLNACHNAHDAFLACQLADFVARCYPNWKDGLSLAMVRKHAAAIAKGSSYRMPGRSGFVADSMTMKRHFDQGTGELLWDNAERNAYMRKAIGYRTYFTSRMTEIADSAFWPETIYSPRDAKVGPGLRVPLKSSLSPRNREGYLDPRKYGGHTRPQNAYWFLFAAKNTRGKVRYFMEGMPITLAHATAGKLQEYADGLAAETGCGKATILKPCIPLRQKLEIRGVPYYLYGSGEIRPAKELLIDRGLAERLFAAPEDLTSDDLLAAYRQLTRSAEAICPGTARLCAFTDKEGLFAKLAREDKVKQLMLMVRKLNGADQTIDMTLLGGKKAGGKDKLSLKQLGEIVWVDESVTGMFERKATFEELCHGL